MAIFFVEAKYFDDEKAKVAAREKAKQLKAEAKAKQQEAEKTKRVVELKRKHDESIEHGPRVPLSPSKRCRLQSPSSPSQHPGVSVHSVPPSPSRQCRGVANKENQSGPASSSSALPLRVLLEQPRFEPAGSATSPTTSSNPFNIDATSDSQESRSVAASKVAHCERLRVEYKLKAPRAKSGQDTIQNQPKKSDEDLDPELDSLINAEFREYKCYRIPVMSFYENDRIGTFIIIGIGSCVLTSWLVTDDHLCVTGGCSRCCQPQSVICCSLCSPSHSAFAFLSALDSPAETGPSAAPVPRASQVPVKYNMDATDFKFRSALHEYRRQKTIAISSGKTAFSKFK